METPVRGNGFGAIRRGPGCCCCGCVGGIGVLTLVVLGKMRICPGGMEQNEGMDRKGTEIGFVSKNQKNNLKAVSYTHLTLPTILLV